MYEELEGIRIEQPKQHIGNTPWQETISLADLYRNGWWITDIFGSYANVVSKSPAYKSRRPYFRCLSLFLPAGQITPQAEKLINKIAKQQWKIYGPMLTSNKKTFRIKNK